MAVKEVTIRFKTDTKGIQKARREFDKINQEAGQTTQKVASGFDNLNKSILRVGASLVGAFAVKAIISNAFKTIKEFEQGMADLGAITGKTGKELDKFRRGVLDVSRKTGKGAADIAKAFQLVGSAAPELLESADALAAVTEQAIILAQAGGLEVPEAAEALTKAMNQFGASASDAAMFTDILATSQQKGTATIAQLSESLKNVGAVAASAGLTFEETNVALQVMAKGGLVGAEAGTGLRAVILRLQAAGVGFVDGQFDLHAAIKETKERFENISDPIKNVQERTKLFGAENIKTGDTLIKQIKIFDELTGKLDEHGNALDQAATRTDTVEGNTEKMTSAYERFILEVAEGDGVISSAINKLLKLGTSTLDAWSDINRFGEVILDETKDLIENTSHRMTKTFKEQLKENELFTKDTEKLIEQRVGFQEEVQKKLNKALADGESHNSGIVATLKARLEAERNVIAWLKEGTEAIEDNTDETDENNKSKEKQISLLEKINKLQAAAAKKVSDRIELDKKFNDTQEELTADEEDNFNEVMGFIEEEDRIREKSNKEKESERIELNDTNEEDMENFLNDLERRQAAEQFFADEKKRINEEIGMSALGLGAALARAAGDSAEAQAAALTFDQLAAIASVVIKTQAANAVIVAEGAALAIPTAGASVATAAGLVTANNVNAGLSIATILAAAIPQFAGMFKDGVIDLQGKGTGTSDSNLAFLSKGESVMTASETREHRPVLQAMRDGNFDEWINKKSIEIMHRRGYKDKTIEQNIFDFSDDQIVKGLKSINGSVNIKNTDQITKGFADAIEEANFINANGYGG
jgi:TP901 family phage tail tape measure protein